MPNRTESSSSQSSHHYNNFVDLDKRLAVLESTVGPPKGSSLMKTTSRLDQQVSLLEAQAPEELVRRLTGLKTELQGFLGGKAQQSQREAKFLENAALVRDLHTQVGLVRDTSADLPLIVARLKSLDEVHRASANTSLRVEKLEALAAGLSQTLASNNQVLATMKSVSNGSSIIIMIIVIYYNVPRQCMY